MLGRSSLVVNTAIIVSLFVFTRGVAAFMLGPVSWPDSGGYISLGEHLRDHFWAHGAGDLWPGFGFRMPGYPLALSTAMVLAGDAYGALMVLLQISLGLIATVFVLLLSTVLLRGRFWPLVPSVLYSVSYIWIWDHAVLTDSIFISLATIVFCALALFIVNERSASPVRILFLSVLLGCMCALRETGMIFCVALTPLFSAWVWHQAGGVSAALGRVMILATAPLAVVGGLLLYNYSQDRDLYLTTGALYAMPFAIAEAELASGDDLFDESTVYGRMARASFDRAGPEIYFPNVQAFVGDVQAETGLSRMDLVAEGQRQFFLAVRENPIAFLEKLRLQVTPDLGLDQPDWLGVGAPVRTVSDVLGIEFWGVGDAPLGALISLSYRVWTQAITFLGAMAIPVAIVWLILAAVGRVGSRLAVGLVGGAVVLILIFTTFHIFTHLSHRYAMTLAAPALVLGLFCTLDLLRLRAHRSIK